MTDKELKELVASLAILQKETDKKIQELEKKIDELLQVQEVMDKKLDSDEIVGLFDIPNDNNLTEEYFINSLKDILKIGNLKFDYLLNNVRLQTKKINDEFDILLVNRDSLALIEVKYKTHPNVIESLSKKIEHLKILPQYKNYKIYAGVAGFYIPDEVVKKAKEKGYFVLKRKGNLIEEYVDNLIPA